MFCRSRYRKFLLELNSFDYKFLFFNEIVNKNKFILLRHDIDADLGAALELAKIEYDLNIKVTYFIMLRSPMYNVFSRSNLKIVKEILSLGHKLGLHFDAYKAHSDTLQNEINNEINILNTVFEVNISAVSFHQPCNLILENHLKIEQINTYDKDDMKGIFYISDSNANERIFNISEIVKYEKVQILIHPMWWKDDMFISTQTTWNNVIIDNFKREEIQLLETERAYGSERCLKII